MEDSHSAKGKYCGPFRSIVPPSVVFTNLAPNERAAFITPFSHQSGRTKEIHHSINLLCLDGNTTLSLLPSAVKMTLIHYLIEPVADWSPILHLHRQLTKQLSDEGVIHIQNQPLHWFPRRLVCLKLASRIMFKKKRPSNPTGTSSWRFMEVRVSLSSLFDFEILSSGIIRICMPLHCRWKREHKKVSRSIP